MRQADNAAGMTAGMAVQGQGLTGLLSSLMGSLRANPEAVLGNSSLPWQPIPLGAHAQSPRARVRVRARARARVRVRAPACSDHRADRA
eukprot:COSAG01_NODE_9750_length_2354_cov_1.781818_3_plen_89_part_00